MGVDRLERDLAGKLPQLDARTVRRLVRCYGTDAARIAAPGQLGEDFGHGLFAAEVNWLVREEWARNADDILWRRTKLGLRFTEAQAHRLTRYLDDHAERRAAAE